jgi:hypothetical protein
MQDALKIMRRKWDETNPQWNDAVRRDFAENHWGPLEDHTVAALKQMDRLSQVMTALRQELSRNGHL